MSVIKVLLFRLYVIIWSLLRVGSVVLLLPVFLAFVYGGVEFWQNRNRVYVPPDPVVCGKMAGNVYEFQRQYFPFWPEYEGKSSLEPGFSNNKTGCDANLRSVFLAMTWPGLEPAEDRLFFEQGLEHEGLLVSISPIVAQEGDLPMLRKYWLSKIPKEAAAKIEYDVLLRLYRAEGFDLDWGYGRKIYLWSEKDGRITSITKCLWQPKEPSFYSCKMTFVVFESLLVEATFLPEKLGQWSKIKTALVQFLISRKLAR